MAAFPSSQSSLHLGEPVQYRPTRSLPRELQEQCAIYFEEGLYIQALTLLGNLLTSGTSWSDDNGRIPTFVPPPHFLAVITTLTVHPSTTTRAKSSDKLAAAGHAIRYLRQLSLIAGSVNARLADALHFQSKTAFRGRASLREKRRDAGADGVDDDDDDTVPINAKLAGDQGLWARAEDFWHVVGWAFNCAATSNPRWTVWKMWLELMLDLMEGDLCERVQMASDSADERSGELVRKSIISQFVNGDSGELSHGRRAKIIRAVFAHGSPKDHAELKEIWKDETKELMTDQRIQDSLKHKNNAEGLSLEDLSEDEDFADEMDLDMSIVKSEEHDRPTRRGRRRTQTLSPKLEDDADTDSSLMDTADALEMYGGTEAIYLRRRFLNLLAKLADVDHSLFATTDDLLDLFSGALRPLPLPVFSVIMMPSGPYRFSGSLHGSLCKESFRPLLSITAPRFDTNYLDQEDMGQKYLPATANTTSVSTNAKVSLLLEAVLWLLKEHDELQYTAELDNAVNEGIQARKAKTTPARGGRSGKKEARTETEKGSDWLDASAKRLQMLMTMLGSGQRLTTSS